MEGRGDSARMTAGPGRKMEKMVPAPPCAGRRQGQGVMRCERLCGGWAPSERRPAGLPKVPV